MMHLICLVINLLIFVIYVKCSLILMTPHIWICDEKTTQTILVDNLKNENVTVNFYMFNNDIYNNFSFTFEPGLKVLNFKLNESLPPSRYRLWYNSESFYYDKRIMCKNRFHGFFIVTDKPIYRDSDKVNIKVVSIDSNLKPIKNVNATIQILDPDYNVVVQYIDEPFRRGLIDNLTFQLSQKPSYGKWQIKVTVKNHVKLAYFYVEEYVLPRFDVNIDVKEYVLVKATSIDVKISGRYTYGKPLIGNGTVKLIKFQYSWEESKNKEIILIQKNFDLTNGNAKIQIPIAYEKEFYFKLNVSLCESMTSENITKSVILLFNSIEFYVDYNSKVFIPNQMNKFRIRLRYNNDQSYAKKRLVLSYNHTNNNLKKVNVTSDKYGFVEFNENFHNITDVKVMISPQHDLDQNAFTYFESYESLNSIRLVISPEKNRKKLGIDSTLSLNIIKLEQNPQCYDAKYFIIRQLKIVNENTIKLCDEVKLDIKITKNFGAHSTFVIYFLDQKQDVIANFYKINLDLNIFRNNLEITFDKNVSNPSELVNVKLKTKKDSLVYLCIVDKSVEILHSPNDLTKKSVHNEFSYFNLGPAYNYDYDSWEINKGLDMLNFVGLTVLSDVKSLTAYYKERYQIHSNHIGLKGPMERDPYSYYLSEYGLRDALNDESAEFSAANLPIDPIRKDFRETWICETFNMGNMSEKQISRTIPDSMTSWIASGFALNDEFGLGVANKKEITTFKKFFVTLLAPRFLIKEEIVTIQAVVFNYFDIDLKEVIVTLEKTDDFKIPVKALKRVINDDEDFDDIHQEEEEEEEEEEEIKSSTSSINLINKRQDLQVFSYRNIQQDITHKISIIKKHQHAVVEFVISPAKIGQLSFTIKAKSKLAWDGETRKIKVKSDGVPETITQSMLVDLRHENTFEKDFQPVIPQNRIVDSEHCSVSIIGDLLGASLNNLDRLINKPVGCGEQNMITFTPNIFALQYLLMKKSSSKIKNIDKMIKNAKENIKQGYQNQLKYRRYDGSFSAFGYWDRSGSTWLTAFVLRSFLQATKYISIDEQSVISQAVEFLKSTQNRYDGSFAELGRIIHTDMQGGARGKLSITAYVTIALIEAQQNGHNVSDCIARAISYLKNQIIHVQDNYNLLLVSYALSSAKLDISRQYFDKCQQKSNINTDGHMYWSKEASPQSKGNVELTAYGLLLNLLNNDTTSSLKIVKYLVSRSNSFGGFSNTQNTIVALQALTQFGLRLAANTSSVNMNVSLNLTHTLSDYGDDDYGHKMANNDVDLGDSEHKPAEMGRKFRIRDDNTIVLQSWDLPSCDYNLNLNASGNGLFLFQLITSYNLPNASLERMFDLDQTTVVKSSSFVNVSTCVTYNQESSPTGLNSTGMTLIEAYLPSGYEADKQQLNKLVKTIESLKMAEVKEDRVVFYLDSLDDGSSLCIEWTMNKLVKVENLKPVEVKVYDYYQSSLRQTIFFNPNK